jgi:hypothetical protein
MASVGGSSRERRSATSRMTRREVRPHRQTSAGRQHQANLLQRVFEANPPMERSLSSLPTERVDRGACRRFAASQSASLTGWSITHRPAPPASLEASRWAFSMATPLKMSVAVCRDMTRPLSSIISAVQRHSADAIRLSGAPRPRSRPSKAAFAVVDPGARAASAAGRPDGVAAVAADASSRWSAQDRSGSLLPMDPTLITSCSGVAPQTARPLHGSSRQRPEHVPSGRRITSPGRP